MDLRKFHYNILCKSELKEQGAEILAGRAKTVSAKHYLIYEIDKMTEQYARPGKNTRNPFSIQLFFQALYISI